LAVEDNVLAVTQMFQKLGRNNNVVNQRLKTKFVDDVVLRMLARAHILLANWRKVIPMNGKPCLETLISTLYCLTAKPAASLRETQDIFNYHQFK